jgi:hypothetical protein
MKMNRLSPALLLLALAGPAFAQDIGPGVMLQELTTLNDAPYAQDARPGRLVTARSQARLPVDGQGTVAGLKAIASHGSGTDAAARSATGDADRTSDAHKPDAADRRS